MKGFGQISGSAQCHSLTWRGTKQHQQLNQQENQQRQQHQHQHQQQQQHQRQQPLQRRLTTFEAAKVWNSSRVKNSQQGFVRLLSKLIENCREASAGQTQKFDSDVIQWKFESTILLMCHPFSSSVALLSCREDCKILNFVMEYFFISYSSL